MVARVATVAFSGIDVLDVDVQVQIGSGLPAFAVVGLPDKAVAESRERVRGALSAMGLALPPKRITVNLAPADLAKEGSHFDLPIALGLLDRAGRAAAGRDRRLPGGGRTGARRRARNGCRRAAGGGSRQRQRAGADLSGRPGRRGGLGGGNPRAGAAASRRADQSFQGHAGAGAAGAEAGGGRGDGTPTSPTSRGRKPPSGRSRSPRPAATIC